MRIAFITAWRASTYLFIESRENDMLEKRMYDEKREVHCHTVLGVCTKWQGCSRSCRLDCADRREPFERRRAPDAEEQMPISLGRNGGTLVPTRPAPPRVAARSTCGHQFGVWRRSSMSSAMPACPSDPRPSPECRRAHRAT